MKRRSFGAPVMVGLVVLLAGCGNRGSSCDSRLYGPIPRAWIIGTRTG